MEQTMIPDTHSFIKDMAAAGMPEPVAEAFVKNYTKHLVGNLTTKQDIAVEIAQLETKLITALGDTKTRIHQMDRRYHAWHNTLPCRACLCLRPISASVNNTPSAQSRSSWRPISRPRPTSRTVGLSTIKARPKTCLDNVDNGNFP